MGFDHANGRVATGHLGYQPPRGDFEELAAYPGSTGSNRNNQVADN
jgi:hypothetical protein